MEGQRVGSLSSIFLFKDIAKMSWMEGPAFSLSTVQNILPTIRRFLSVAKLSYSALFFARYRSSIFVKERRYCNMPPSSPKYGYVQFFPSFNKQRKRCSHSLIFWGFIVYFTVKLQCTCAIIYYWARHLVTRDVHVLSFFDCVRYRRHLTVQKSFFYQILLQ